MDMNSESEVTPAFGNRKSFEADPQMFLQVGWSLPTQWFTSYGIWGGLFRRQWILGHNSQNNKPVTSENNVCNMI